MLHEGVIAGRDVTRRFQGEAEMKEAVSDKAARMSLVTTATRRRDAAHAETDYVTVSFTGIRMPARHLKSACVGPETAWAIGGGRYGT